MVLNQISAIFINNARILEKMDSVEEKKEADTQEEADKKEGLSASSGESVPNEDSPVEDSDSLLDENVKKTGTRNTIIAALIVIAMFILVINIQKITDFFAKEEVPLPDDYYYNGKFHFVNDGGLWKTEIIFGNKFINIPLHYSPRDLENVSIEGEVDSRFINSSRLYITFDPGESIGYIALATAELTLNLVQGMNIGVVAACTTNSTEACYSRPIVACNSTDAGVIYIKESKEPKIIMDGNCITVQGKGTHLVRAVDRLLLKWYRVMD